MKMFVAPPPSVETAVCSAKTSVSRSRAAAACKGGIEARVMTPAVIWASRKVHVPDSTKGSRKPLKKAAAGKRMLAKSITMKDFLDERL